MRRWWRRFKLALWLDAHSPNPGVWGKKQWDAWDANEAADSHGDKP